MTSTTEFAREQRQFVGLLKKLSYKEGRFTLTSGKESNYYVDCKNVALHPRGAALLGKVAWQLLDPRQFGGVGGPTLGADPIATAMSLAALNLGVEVPAFIIRKEAKKHGTSQWIEGRELLRPGANLLIVEDVVTTGGSSVKAIEKARAEGFTVTKLLALLDRGEGGREALAKVGVELTALATIGQVQNYRDSGEANL